MSISSEDIHNNHLKTLSIGVKHLMYCIEEMVPKDKRTRAPIYPVELTEEQKNYIMNYLQKFYDDLMER
jgi:hypothetical protein